MADRAPAPRSIRPKATVEAERVSYLFTVKVSGRPSLSFAGHSTEELVRDLEAVAAELEKSR